MSPRWLPGAGRTMRRLLAVLVVAAVAGCSAPVASTSTTSTPGSTLAPTLRPSPTPIPTPTAVGCPDPSSLAIVLALDSSLRLTCFGRSALAFEGIFGCGGCGGVEPRSGTPAWLAGKEVDFLNDTSGLQAGRLALHFPPPLAPPAAGSILRVIGHFDDPRAGDCRIAEPQPGNPEGSPIPIPEAEAVQLCRERFVVDSFSIIGTGPIPVG